jgi:hypothetical protein
MRISIRKDARGMEQPIVSAESHTHNVGMRLPYRISPVATVPASSRNLNVKLIGYCCGNSFSHKVRFFLRKTSVSELKKEIYCTLVAYPAK